MEEQVLKCDWCTFVAKSKGGRGKHMGVCKQRPRTELVEQDIPTIAAIKQDIEVEQATAAVLLTKFPRGIRTPDDCLRAVRLVKAVEHG